MKNTIKWLEGKIGKYNTSTLLLLVGGFGVVTGVFWTHYSSFWFVLYLPSVYLVAWNFNRVNKYRPKEKGK